MYYILQCLAGRLSVIIEPSTDYPHPHTLTHAKQGPSRLSKSLSKPDVVLVWGGECMAGGSTGLYGARSMSWVSGGVWFSEAACAVQNDSRKGTRASAFSHKVSAAAQSVGRQGSTTEEGFLRICVHTSQCSKQGTSPLNS